MSNITTVTYTTAAGYERTANAQHEGDFDAAAWQAAHEGCSIQRTETYLDETR